MGGHPPGITEKKSNLTLVREKSGKLGKVGGKVWEIVVWLWCATAVTIVTK